jgi:hypothetical protein
MSNFGCCGGNNQKEKVIMADGDSIDVILATRKGGQRYVHGAETKKRYGYFDQGDLIPAVEKVDVRLRPTDFVCPNCRREFTVTPDDVFCATCSRVIELSPIDTRQLAERMTAVQQPVAAPMPPPPLSFEEQVSVTHPDPSTYLSEIDFGRKVNKGHKNLLVDEGIVTLYDVRDTGFEDLVAIVGIGETVANALLEASAELEIS